MIKIVFDAIPDQILRQCKMLQTVAAIFKVALTCDQAFFNAGERGRFYFVFNTRELKKKRKSRRLKRALQNIKKEGLIIS